MSIIDAGDGVEFTVLARGKRERVSLRLLGRHNVLNVLAAVAVGAWATRRLGGLTGDSYGAIAEVAEVVMLLLIVVLNAWFS